jgi:hypothetical protein
MVARMSPDIKLEEHRGCGGIAVIVPSGSVYGGSVLFCLKCMEDERDRLLAAIRLAVEHQDNYGAHYDAGCVEETHWDELRAVLRP